VPVQDDRPHLGPGSGGLVISRVLDVIPGIVLQLGRTHERHQTKGVGAFGEHPGHHGFGVATRMPEEGRGGRVGAPGDQQRGCGAFEEQGLGVQEARASLLGHQRRRVYEADKAWQFLPSVGWECGFVWPQPDDDARVGCSGADGVQEPKRQVEEGTGTRRASALRGPSRGSGARGVRVESTPPLCPSSRPRLARRATGRTTAAGPSPYWMRGPRTTKLPTLTNVRSSWPV